MRAQTMVERIATFLGYDATDSTILAQFLTPLNQALEDIVSDLRPIVRHKTFPATSATYKYVLPTDFLALIGVRWTTYPPLVRTTVNQIYAERYIVQTGTPRGYDIAENAAALRKSGTATGGSTTSLVDSGGFGSEPKAGDTVLNTTDGSQSIISTIAGDTITLVEALFGGADDTFASGDTYEILSASEHLKTLLLHPAPGTSDSGGVESISALYRASHRTFTQTDLDNANDDLEIGEELHTALIHRTAYWFFGLGTAEAATQNQEYNLARRRAYPNVKSKVEQSISLWERSVAYPQTTITGPGRVWPSGYGY